jgi:hypothetical protein
MSIHFFFSLLSRHNCSLQDAGNDGVSGTPRVLAVAAIATGSGALWRRSSFSRLLMTDPAQFKIKFSSGYFNISFMPEIINKKRQKFSV